MPAHLRSMVRAGSLRARPYALPLMAAAVVAWLCLRQVLERAGGPALPLDDSFIHLQYARRLAEGHFLRYVPGAAYSSGATSLLWPLILAPATRLGSETFPILVVWLLGGLLHAAVALEVARLTAGLAGKSAGLAAGATTIVFGAFAWFAYSGMETLALAWILTRGARVAAERFEGERVWGAGPPPSDLQLAALGALAPLIRPEGALLSIVALVVGIMRPRSRLRAAALSVLVILGAATMPLSHALHSGRAVSATAQVKWLLLDPHLDRDQQLARIAANLRLLVTDLLDGGDWTHVFVPRHAVVAIVAGCLAALWLGFRDGRRARALLVVGFVLATALPCSYGTLLWNRVRYIWPFAPGWIVAAGCLYGALGELAARRHPLARMVTPILAWGTVAMVGSKLERASEDLATSARAIERQQVTLGRWARAHLPKNALIGVNDTGAIAYYAHRRTFDVVGLTTAGEAPYWADGAGSRFEHYERLPLEELPTFFIVYPRWMAMDPVLGLELHRASVWDQSILGGSTMMVHEARWDRLHSGEAPVQATGERIDELDVADLVSERDHGLARGTTAATWNVVAMTTLVDGRDIVDGGRRERLEDRFTLKASEAATLWLRVTSEVPLSVVVDGQAMLTPEVVERHEAWQEMRVSLPAATAARSLQVRREDGGAFASWHYWLYR